MISENSIITVFGGTGFVGRHVIWQLAKTGATIRVATRVPKRALFLKPAGTVGQIIPFFCDINDDASVRTVMAGATHAVNLVSILNQCGKNTFQRVNVEAAERVARIANEEQLDTLVHISALGTSADSLSEYARSKAEGEKRARAAFSRTVTLRPGVVFGPEDEFFNRFAAMARTAPALPLIGGGRTKLQPVYAGDIAQAVLNIIASPDIEKFDGKVFELAQPRAYTFRELMDVMQAQTGQTACYVSLPFGIAKIIGTFAGLLPGKPLTCDQVKSLQRDSVATPGTPGLAELGVEATALESILPTYLRQYRAGGAYMPKKQVP